MGSSRGAPRSRFILASIPWIIILILPLGHGGRHAEVRERLRLIGRVLSPGLGFSWSMLHTFAFYATAMTNFVGFGSMTASYLGFEGGNTTPQVWAAALENFDRHVRVHHSPGSSSSPSSRSSGPLSI